ncbi:MAG: PDZ domain-containing protein [Desulfurococcales archaeon]|nr:PDZ domain-containing protein [Desulfurococcales archaeon]
MDKGVIVVNVMPNTPAHLKGLRVGDIIVRAGGLEIKKPSDLRKAIEDKIEEEAIELEVIRGTIKYKVIVPIIVEAI